MTDETLHSVIFRTGPITPADYAEAIKDLQNAVRQAECVHICCSVCEDSGHTAETCHHNPLVAARKWAKATGVWQCWHCGFVATNGDEAKDHFGANDRELAKCQLNTFATGVEAAAKRIESRRDRANDCECLGPMDMETGVCECSLEVKGGDCLCSHEIEALDEAIRLIRSVTLPRAPEASS